jgi:hypothetical protein
MAKVHILLKLIFVIFAAPLMAQQPAQPVRLELPFDKHETRTEVIALPDSSLLLYYKISNTWNTKAEFNFIRYNSMLQEVWKTTAQIKPDNEYIRFYTEAPFTYLIFSGDTPEDFTILKINLADGTAEPKTYELKGIEAIFEFNVLDGKYFFIGSSRDTLRPILLYLNPNEKDAKILPSVYGGESSFSDMLADHENGRLDVVMSESNGRISRLQVKSFNVSGQLLRNYFVLQQDDKSLLNAEVSRGDTTQKILVGTYGLRDLRYTRGFFTSTLSSSFAVNNFYSLLQLQNFLKHMKPRREARVRKREAEKVKSGKDPSLKYRILLHDLINTTNGYILVGESYYPLYGSNQGLWNNTRSSGRERGYDGFRRTHAVALGFDKYGTLLWDNVFPLNNLSTPELYHAIEIGYSPTTGKLIMLYPNKDEITYQVIHEHKVIEKEQEFKVRTQDKLDKVQFNESLNVKRWYSANFVAFGFQRIKSVDNNYRNIFYINKISF